MSDNPFREHIRAVRKFEEYHDQRKEDLLADYEGKGYRIIDGGGAGKPTKWEIIDYHTKKTLLEGEGDTRDT